MEPIISVAIPVYKVELYIDNIINQTYRNLEIKKAKGYSLTEEMRSIVEKGLSYE